MNSFLFALYNRKSLMLIFILLAISAFALFWLFNFWTLSYPLPWEFAHVLVTIFKFIYPGSSQARDQSRAAAAGHCHSHSNTRSAPHATACGNTRSLTHWEGLGIKPASSWTLCQVLNLWATMGTPSNMFLNLLFSFKVSTKRTNIEQWMSDSC